MKDHTRCFRGFSVLSEAWYGKTALSHNAEVSEEINIGMFHPHGGTTGEFGINWIKLGDSYSPRLEVFNDAWSALWKFTDLLERLSDLDSSRTQPFTVIAVLHQLGIKDLTDRRPRNSNEPPRLCRCCKQPIQATKS